MNLLAVIGNPVGHSLSPQIHQMFADQIGMSVTYQKVQAPLDGFAEASAKLLDQGAVGFNITVPFKFEACDLADTLSQYASRAQAVNTIKRERSGLLSGHNTDGLGLVRDMTENLAWSIEGKQILVLGAGGAVSGILEPILEQGPSSIHIVNRTHAKAVALAEKYSGKIQAVKPSELSAHYDLVISGSSAGLPMASEGSQEMPIPKQIIGERTCCYDLIYSKTETPFLSLCRDLGAKERADGLGMLVEQAALAFEIWFGKRPDSASVINKLRGGHMNDEPENPDLT